MKEMLKYQDLELRLKKLENDLLNSDERKGASSMQNYLKDCQIKLIELNKKSEKISKMYADMKKTYEDIVAKLRQISESADKASEEKLQDFSEIVSTFSCNLSKIDKELANMSKQMSSILGEYDSIMKNARNAKGKLIKYRDEYNKKKQEIEPAVQKLSKELKEQEKKVDKNMLAKYLSKHNEKNPVFVREQNGRCSGCRMEIAGSNMNILKSKKFIECENCGRIIYID